ncbi:MAG: MarR family winged helix-turn-helix transcriptional regulator [Lawsonibacter sp.]|jgi:DNA-binding MarR family transcriptional regulator
MDQVLKMQWKQQSPACGWYISYLYRRSFSQMSSAFKSIGLSGNQSVVLVGVYRNEGINQRTLADTIAMAPGVMSRVLRELEDAGYVEKRRDEENRRNYLLYLTPAGTEAAERSQMLQRVYWEDLLQDLTAEEKSTLNTLLEKMERRAAQAAVPKDVDDQGAVQGEEA